MRALVRPLLVVALSVAGCGGGGSATNPADVGAADEGGPASRRGDRSGPLLGGDSDGGGDAVVVPDSPPPDGPAPDAASMSPDSAPPSPDVASPLDLAADATTGPDPCAPNGRCELLAADYRTAVVKGQSCSTLIKGQCALQRPANLFCGCAVWVNATDEIDAIRKQSDDAGCLRCNRVCPLVLCRKLEAGVCRVRGPVPIGVTGTCADQSDPQPL